MQAVSEAIKEEAVEKQDKKVYPHICPVCGVQTNYIYRIYEEKTKLTGDYFRCQCGVIFLDEFPDITGVYNEEYVDTYLGTDPAQQIHAARTYAPIIEELTLKRMMLDVGMAGHYNLKFFEDRGWVTYGIDVADALKAGGNIYRGNFENYDFEIRLTDELKQMLGDLKPSKRTFDLIWMSHVLEHFQDPIQALKKAHDLLSETGVLYIATPDIDFINKTGVGGWPHWKSSEHYILWSEQALVRELERIGFNVIMKRRNYSSRYISWWDLHVIAQKRYF